MKILAALFVLALLGACDPDSAVDYKCPDGTIVWHDRGVWHAESGASWEAAFTEGNLAEFCDRVQRNRLS
jgi:hypothetical protein